MNPLHGADRVQHAATRLGISIRLTPRGPASSVQEAAANLGIDSHQIVKTLVAKAKRTQSTKEYRYILALIPGDRSVDWSKLRKLAGMKKMSLAPPDEGFEATGYHPGSINPFGTTGELEIYADSSITGEIAMGAGEPDLNLFVDSTDLFAAFNVTIGDIARPPGQ